LGLLRRLRRLRRLLRLRRLPRLPTLLLLLLLLLLPRWLRRNACRMRHIWWGRVQRCCRPRHHQGGRSWHTAVSIRRGGGSAAVREERCRAAAATLHERVEAFHEDEARQGTCGTREAFGRHLTCFFITDIIGRGRRRQWHQLRGRADRLEHEHLMRRS
jgi:hypothetical protein